MNAVRVEGGGMAQPATHWTGSRTNSRVYVTARCARLRHTS